MLKGKENTNVLEQCKRKSWSGNLPLFAIYKYTQVNILVGMCTMRTRENKSRSIIQMKKMCATHMQCVWMDRYEIIIYSYSIYMYLGVRGRCTEIHPSIWKGRLTSEHFLTPVSTPQGQDIFWVNSYLQLSHSPYQYNVPLHSVSLHH